MADCSTNNMFLPRPTTENTNQCLNNGCTLSLTDPVGCGKISRRPHREKVREQLKDYCLLMLGAPVVKVELDQQNLDAAVDLALQVFEDYAGREYFTYYTFNTLPGRSVYSMPADVGLIRQVYYREQPSMAFSSTSELGGVLPIEYYYPGSSYASQQGGLMDPNQPVYGKAGEWVGYKQYEQMYYRLSSMLGGWEWVDGTCNIKLYPIPCRPCPVIVHYLQKKPDFKQVTQAMQVGAYIYARLQLANIRGKYENLPSPGGGIRTNAERMEQQAREDMKEWMNDLIYRYSGDNILPITMD